jgi:hypothetical protein
MTTKTTTLTAKTLIELLAEDHEVARHFALLVIDATLKSLPTADDVGGIANISVGGFKPIDVIVDNTDSDSSRSVYAKLCDNRVSFRKVCSGEGSTSLVGSIAGTDWIRIFSGEDGKPHLAVDTGAVLT